MALPGETLRLGAPRICEDCKATVELSVCSSAAGFYVGTRCDCGPYSRESEYARTYEQAAAWLADWENAELLHGR